MTDRGAPGGRKLSRRRRAATTSIVALAVMCPSACGGSGQGPEPRAAGSSTVAAAAQACADVRPSFGCDAVVVAGRPYRYSVQRRAAARNARTGALVDLGGPGRALFGSNDMLAFARRWPGRDALVFVEEPWVTQAVTRSCRASLSRFYRALRLLDTRRASKTLVAACDLRHACTWGWTRERYDAVVDAVLARERLHLVGVVGTSYGAVRASDVWMRAGVQWAILDSPAPRTATGGAYLTAREQGALQAFAQVCGPCRRRGGALHVLAEARHRLARAPVTLPTRTPPVAGTDVDAALIGLARLRRPERTQVAAAVARSPVAAAQTIGLLSDATLLRYGEYDLSPAFLAYLDEVCRRYGPWPPAGSTRAGGALLTALHGPCGELARVAARTGRPPRLCVAHGTDDFVTPRAFAEQWLRRDPAATFVSVPGAVHGDARLATRCADALAIAG